MAEEVDKQCLSSVVNLDVSSANPSDVKVVGLFGRKVTKPFPLKIVNDSTAEALRPGWRNDAYELPDSSVICVTYES
jgi:hypothetical protein